MGTGTKFEEQFKLFIKCLAEAGCLDDIIIVGSWAEYLYSKCGLLKGYEPSIKTLDVDLLIPNLNKPRTPSDLVRVAKEAGFTYTEDSLTGDSKFIGDELFEVEFLIAQKGNGTQKLPRTNIGVNAQQLTHIDMLVRHTRQAILDEYRLIVPTPEAYAIHKMIINHTRKGKALSDREKIDILIPYLNQEELNAVYNELSKKETKYLSEYINNYVPSLVIEDKDMQLKSLDVLLQEADARKSPSGGAGTGTNDSLDEI